MKYLSLFSGVEAATLAWAPLGWEPVAFAEFDAFPSAVLAHRYPNVPNLGDVTQIDGTQFRGTVDLIVGGSPCQGFSVAGKQKGLEDPRSKLALAYVRLLDEVHPKWFVWENVPGVLSTRGGQTLESSCLRLLGSGISAPGEFWTLNTSESTVTPTRFRNAAGAYLLSDILMDGVIPQKYFLSARACEGVLRRAEARGKTLPPLLEAALIAQRKAFSEMADSASSLPKTKPSEQ